MYFNTSIHIHVCIYTYTCIYTYIHVYLYIYTYICIYIYIYIYIHVYIYIHKHAYLYVYVYTHPHGHTHTHTYTCTYACIHSFAPQTHANVSTLHANTFTPHIQTQVRTNTQMCTHMHTRTHRHMLTHSHTHIHCSHTRSLCRILVDYFVLHVQLHSTHTFKHTQSLYLAHTQTWEASIIGSLCRDVGRNDALGFERFCKPHSFRRTCSAVEGKSLYTCTHHIHAYAHQRTQKASVRSVLDISNQTSASDNSWTLSDSCKWYKQTSHGTGELFLASMLCAAGRLKPSHPGAAGMSGETLSLVIMFCRWWKFYFGGNVSGFPAIIFPSLSFLTFLCCCFFDVAPLRHQSHIAPSTRLHCFFCAWMSVA